MACLTCAATLAIAAGCSSGSSDPELAVDLVTDLRPGLAFDAVYDTDAVRIGD